MKRFHGFMQRVSRCSFIHSTTESRFSSAGDRLLLIKPPWSAALSLSHQRAAAFHHRDLFKAVLSHPFSSSSHIDIVFKKSCSCISALNTVCQVKHLNAPPAGKPPNAATVPFRIRALLGNKYHSRGLIKLCCSERFRLPRASAVRKLFPSIPVSMLS